MFSWIIITAFLFHTINSAPTSPSLTRRRTTIRALNDCINVNSQAVCPQRSWLGTALSVVTSTTQTTYNSIEILIPFSKNVGSAEFQAYFPSDGLDTGARSAIPAMVAQLQWPADETEVFFDPASGCLKNKNSQNWNMEGNSNCWARDNPNTDIAFPNPYWVVGYIPHATIDSVAPPYDSAESVPGPVVAEEPASSTGSDPDLGEPGIIHDVAPKTSPGVGRRRLPRFFM